MANNHFSFPGTAYFTEGPVFPSSLFSSTEDNLDASMSYIDPVLQSPSTSDLYIGQWDSPQDQLLVQRYLEDNQKTAFFNADVPSKMMSNRAHMNPAVGVSPVPRPPSHARFASPISSPGPSSASDNMHSPPTDNDSHYEPFGSPMADPASLQLPFQQPNSYDPHWATHEVQFMGMGPLDTGVNLSDISPNSQPVDCYDNESSNLDLAFPQRGFSFESYTSSNSQSDMDVTTHTAALDLPVRRLASPEPVVKEEINAATQYPPPPGSSHDVDMDESEDEQAHQPTTQKRKTPVDDDDESKPNKRQNLHGRRQSRRGAPKSQPQQSTPAVTNLPSSSTQPAKALPPPLSNTNKHLHACPECSQPFKDQTLLENHIKKQHTRPFICVFHFAGCPSTFASKNEWKRHVASQHLLLNYWLCDEGPCAGVAASKASHQQHGAQIHLGSGSRSSSRAIGRSSSRNTAVDSQAQNETAGHGGGGGVIFNRKDLYTQHVRRMHMPPQIKKSLKQSSSASSASTCTKKASSSAEASMPQGLQAQGEWETRLKALQSRAIRERCKLPLMMTCPAVECEMVFHGPDSWDQRMEHVARHLERAAVGKEAPVRFGSLTCSFLSQQQNGEEEDDNDRTLVEWASREDVGIIRPSTPSSSTKGGKKGGWELVSLLKRGSQGQGQAQQNANGNGNNANVATVAAGGQKGGRGGIVMVQPTSVGKGSKRRVVNTTVIPAAAAGGAATSNVRFAPPRQPVKSEDDEVEIKNEIVVTSSSDDDEDDEIVVDGEDVYEEEDLDAEGEEEDE